MNSNLKGRVTALACVLVASGSFLFAFREVPKKILADLCNYPNPFRSSREETWITYSLPEEMSVQVKIVDLFGQPVKEFVFSPGEPGGQRGENVVRWDGKDEQGDYVSKGGYLCQVIAASQTPVRAVRKIGVIH